MATPGKRRKRYLDADQPYLIPVSTLRFQKTLVGQGANAGTSVVTEPLDGDEGRENGGYRSDPLGTDEDDIQDCHGAYRDDPVDTDEDDAEDCHGAYRDDPVDTDEDDAQDCHGVDVGDVSTDSEHASQDQADDGGDSTDDEHPDGEVSREKSLEEAVISEDDDDEEMGPGSIEDLLTLCVEEFGASMLPHSPTSKAGAIAMVISYAVSERSTWAGLGKLLTLVNALFGSAVLPTSIYKLRKLWTKKKENLVKYHYLCPCCDTVLNSSDSIARCDVCNFEESTEKLRHGCVRYVADEAPIPRTSELVVRDMELAQRLGSPVNGIKGPSPLMNLEGFDLVAGMSVEYMHCVLQGVVRQVTELLFSSTSSRQAYYIGNRFNVSVTMP
ncbi:uncharacterized protein ISCGN_011626 [Ixodes scapularis]